MPKQTVEVVRGWSGGPYGSRDEGETFDYDLDKDPDKLRALGLVKAAAPAKAPETK